ncbi:MAG: response regulator transcription factor [Candidatus Riflebacteria bacterium]|nr:response regulator transcription factor [Candidatus Riflebacteria bacterium]
MPAHILAVDDEEDILELVKYNLEKESFRVTCVTSAEEAVRASKLLCPDLILLDIMLSGNDGFSVTRILKSNPDTSKIPIIFLSAKGDEIDIVTGLELGAEDYITKPFSPKVLIARVRAVLRRKQPVSTEHEDSRIRKYEVLISPDQHLVQVEDQAIELTNSEFKLLLLMVRRSGVVFTRNQIINSVRGDDCPVTDRSVDVHIASLRKKLGIAGKYIESVRGVGYRFSE